MNNTPQIQPLTCISEDENLLKNSVRVFAETSIRPLVQEMDEAASIPSHLIKQLFDLGVMGIEIPENYGGSSGTVSYTHLTLPTSDLV